MGESNRLTITHVDTYGRFLQIYGYKKPELFEELSARMKAYTPTAKKLKANGARINIENGTKYLVWHRGTKTFQRCVPISKPGAKFTVELIDTGEILFTWISEVVELDENDGTAEFLSKFPPMANKYILAEFACEWKNGEIDLIDKKLRNTTLTVFNEESDSEMFYVSLLQDSMDVASMLLKNGMGVKIWPADQKAEVRVLHGQLSTAKNNSLNKKSQQSREMNDSNNNNGYSQIASSGKTMIQSILSGNDRTTINSRKETANIQNGNSSAALIQPFPRLNLSKSFSHLVVCSHVETPGPNLFWLQLQSQTPVLHNMNHNISNFPLKNIASALIIGMPCIVRSAKDGKLYRATIQKIEDNGCRAIFVDYGKSERILSTEIFEIPEKFKGAAFGIQCKLDGCDELQEVNSQIKEYFQSIVQYPDAELRMRVKSLDFGTIHCCDLFYRSQSVLELLKKKCNEPSAFSNPKHLSDGDEVIIRSARTAQQFFVQRADDLQPFNKMMDDLSSYCNQQQGMDQLPTNGKCYAVRMDTQNEWCRAKLLNQTSNDRFSVRLVDSGKEVFCVLRDMMEIPHEFQQMPQQAIECCLLDFAKIATVTEATGNQLRAVADRKKGEELVFRVSIHGRQPNAVYIVDLHDEKQMPLSISIFKSNSVSQNGQNSEIEANASNETATPMIHDDINRRSQQLSESTQGLTVAEQSISNVPVEVQKTEICKTMASENPIESTETCKAATDKEPTAVNGSAESQLAVENIAFITHLDSPNRFYMQLDSDTDASNAFQDMLGSTAPSLPPLDSYIIGSSCLAKYAVDDSWYRAKIINNDEENTTIQFIDFGNIESVSDKSLLKATDEKVNERKPLAFACSLAIQPKESDQWSEKAYEKLKQLVELPLRFECIYEHAGVNYVRLMVDDRDITKELISEGLAEAHHFLKFDEKCYVTHINSLSDFFIQFDSDSQTLDFIEKHLDNASQFEILSQPDIGAVCSALFDDGKYYRGKVIDNRRSENGIQVEFLDYGNVCGANEIRSLDKTLSEIPELRQRCCLHTPDTVKTWSAECETKFRELSDGGSTEFTVRLVKPGKKPIIELLLEGKPIHEFLLSETVVDGKEIVVNSNESAADTETSPAVSTAIASGKNPCVVSHLSSPSDFFVQLDASVDDLEQMSQHLAHAATFKPFDASTVTVGTIGAALFEDDSFYYRAKVLGKAENGYKVLFIDFGNESISHDLRELPPVITSVQPLAMQCKLKEELVNGLDAKAKEVCMDILAVTMATVEIEIVDSSTSPVTVNFFENNKDIFECIKERLPPAEVEARETSSYDVAEALLMLLLKEAVTYSSTFL